jgi:hypothetical protein
VTKFRKAGWAALALVLGGCDYLNATKGVEPPPAEGRSFPNLATVPQPPPVDPAAARRAEVGELTAARNETLREDQELRAIDPGRALPPPRPRAAPAPQARVPTGSAADPTQQQDEPVTTPPQRPPATAAMPRPELSRSLFMGTVVPAAERGPLAEFQHKVLQDSVAMARRTGGRIRLAGGRSAEERQDIIRELVGLGLPASRIQAAPDSAAPERAGIDVLVEN